MDCDFPVCYLCACCMIFSGVAVSICGFLTVVAYPTTGIISFCISTNFLIVGCCICMHARRDRSNRKMAKSSDHINGHAGVSNIVLASQINRLEQRLAQQSNSSYERHRVIVWCYSTLENIVFI